jgi:hypothetical protein
MRSKRGLLAALKVISKVFCRKLKRKRNKIKKMIKYKK